METRLTHFDKEVKWNADRPRQVYELALLGCSEADMAHVMGIHPDTITTWKRVHPEFAEQLEAGRTLADAKVAHALYLCATGYEYEEQHAALDRQGVPHVVTVKKQKPPEAWAAAKWLGIRRKNEWSEQTHVTVNNTLTVNKIDLTCFKPEELALLEQMGLKQLSEQSTQ